MVSMIGFIISVCITSHAVLTGAAWYWITLNVVCDIGWLALAVRDMRRM